MGPGGVGWAGPGLGWGRGGVGWGGGVVVGAWDKCSGEGGGVARGVGQVTESVSGQRGNPQIVSKIVSPNRIGWNPLLVHL